MNVLTDSSFGIAVSYLLPGFTLLATAGVVSPTIRAWLGASPADAPTVGGFLYATLASLSLGLICSTVRWLVLDSLHHATGIRSRSVDFSRLQEHVTAFRVLVADYYVYYKFHGNMLIALAIAYSVWRWNVTGHAPFNGFDLLFVAIEVVLYAGSRDTLAKYYDRRSQLLSSRKR
jgi:hypothetical protein